jgi:hypothetical protein
MELERVLVVGAWTVILAGLLVMGMAVSARAKNWGWVALLGLLFLLSQTALLWVVTQVLAIV